MRESTSPSRPEPQPEVGRTRTSPTDAAPQSPAKQAEPAPEQRATEREPTPVPVEGAGERVVPMDKHPPVKVTEATVSEKQEPQRSQQDPAPASDPAAVPVLPAGPELQEPPKATEHAELTAPALAPEVSTKPALDPPSPLLPDEFTVEEPRLSPTRTSEPPLPVTAPESSTPPEARAEPQPPSESAQTTPQPAAPPSGASVRSGDPAIENDKDSDASSIVKAADYRNGKVQAGEGLDIKTLRPEFSKYTKVTAVPRNPIVEIWFDRTGKAVNVELLQSSGYKDVDQPVLNAVWGWTAKGKVLDELPKRKPRAVVKLQITMLLRS